VDYLFDYKQLSATNQTQQLLNLRNLTTSWLNASAEKKKEVTEALLSGKTFKAQLANVAPKNLRDLYVKKDYFVSDVKFGEIEEFQI